MRIIKFDDKQNVALRKFISIGGVVEFYLVSKDPNGSEFEQHRAAALHALRAVQKRVDYEISEMIKIPEYSKKNREDFFNVVYDESKVEGNKITFDTFIGTQYDPVSRRIIVRGKSSSYLNSYFIAGDAETESNVVSIYREDEILGYSNAFIEPPYRLRGEPIQLQEIFTEVEIAIFDGFQRSADIWCWSEDCSNYFDAGKEWWGSYFYTYSNPGADRVVCVLASATD